MRVERVEDLAHLPRASVLHWEFKHFVVFEEATRDGAWIVDPAHGRRRIGREELRRAFTGVALTFEPGQEFEPGGERTLNLGRYLRALAARRGRVRGMLLMSVVLQVLALATPLLTGVLVDRVVPAGDHDLLRLLAAG